MNEINHSFISGSSVLLPVRHSPRPLAAGSVLCLQAQPSTSAEELNSDHYHWRPKCRLWFEHIFQLISVPRQVTFFSYLFFSTTIFFFAVQLANRCSAVGICQRSHRRESDCFLLSWLCTRCSREASWTCISVPTSLHLWVWDRSLINIAQQHSAASQTLTEMMI